MPFPVNVGLALERFICDVPPVRVNVSCSETAVPKSNDPESVVVPEPSAIVLVFELLDEMFAAVRLYETRSKDPLVTVKLDVPIFNALPSVQPQPTPLTVIAEANVTPLVVSVLPVVDPVKIMLPV